MATTTTIRRRRRTPSDKWFEGEALAIYRLQAGMTQGQVADRLEITQSYVARLERDGTDERMAARIKDVVDKLVVNREKLIAEGNARADRWAKR